MSAIIWSWPWYDRALAGALIFGMLYAPYAISKQLTYIIKLLERADEREWDKQLREKRPDLFD